MPQTSPLSWAILAFFLFLMVFFLITVQVEMNRFVGEAPSVSNCCKLIKW